MFGPYKIVGPLGRGGMGEVYHARDDRLGRDIALKALREEDAEDADLVTRFEREARAASSPRARSARARCDRRPQPAAGP